MNMAVASLTRFRPSLIPARRNNVRRCCFTVRGLMASWLAISLLLHPCTSSRNTCWSRGVILISFRLIMDVRLLLTVQSWGRDPLETNARYSPNLRRTITSINTATYELLSVTTGISLEDFHEQIPIVESAIGNKGVWS